jgi:hypothetical protein
MFEIIFVLNYNFILLGTFCMDNISLGSSDSSDSVDLDALIGKFF